MSRTTRQPTGRNVPQDWYQQDLYPDNMPPFRRLLVERLLKNTAMASPSSPAVLFEDRVITYAELDHMADATANGLTHAGVKQGDVVAIRAANTPETWAATFGIARVGASMLPLNPMYTPTEIAFQVDDAHASLVIGAGGIEVADLITPGPLTPVRVDVDEQSPYWVRFTSGTTGKPRAFANSQRNITIQAIYTAAEFSYRSDDVLLVNAPLAHAALVYALGIVVMGGAIALTETFDPQTVWQDCDRFGVTQMFMVPTMLSASLDSPGEGKTIRNMLITASTCPNVIRDRANERFPHVDIMEGYGASELGMISVMHRREGQGHEGSVGRPRWGTRIRILDEDGSECVAAQVGMIYTQGPIVSGGYVGSVPAPPNAFRDGWVTAGDMGYLDEEGYLHLVDRRQDLIISGGMNVYPAEVENVVLEVAGVREVAVVGTPDEKWGQIVTAVVAGSAAAAEIDVYCRKVLAAYKVPRRFTFVDSLPKSSTGKILRRLAVDVATKVFDSAGGGADL